MNSKALFPTDMERTAAFSSCGRFRHALGRHWDRSLGYVTFIGLNPSTADAEKDDPTIRRCICFARDWGYGGIEMCNLFDWRATDPKDLPRKNLSLAVSYMNEIAMRVRTHDSKVVIAAWGNVPWAQGRIDEVFRNVFKEEKRWDCLGFTKDRFPRHPLYVPKVTMPTLFW